jgi:hypothetical protein
MKIFMFIFWMLCFFGNTLGVIAHIRELREKDTPFREIIVALNILGIFIAACILRGYIK